MRDSSMNKELNINNSLAINSSARPSGALEFNGQIEIKENEVLKKKDENLIENDEIINIKENNEIGLSCYRYVIVIIFFLLNFINGMHWITFAACAAKFGKFYHLSNLGVDFLSMIYMLVYIISSFFCSYYIDKISMKNGLRLAAVLIFVGAGFKIFLNVHIAFAFVGQFLASSLQPAILNSPAKLAATWFDEKSRVLVTSICCLANTIGVMFGFVIHTFVMEENTVNPRIFKRDFRTYVIIEACISFGIGLGFIIFFKEKPEKPPSKSQENKDMGEKSFCAFCDGLKELKQNKNFIYLLISLSCVVGYINMVATIFNAYMALYKISDENASYTSAISNVAGIIFAIIVSRIIDKFKLYKKSIIICNIICLISYAITIFLMEFVKTKYLVYVSYVGYTLIIGFAVPIYTSGMDLVCEVTYGIGESTSDGIIMIGNQIMGIVGIIINYLLRIYLKKYKWLTNFFGFILFLVSLYCLFCAKEDLKRKKEDEGNNNGENKLNFDIENDKDKKLIEE